MNRRQGSQPLAVMRLNRVRMQRLMFPVAGVEPNVFRCSVAELSTLDRRCYGLDRAIRRSTMFVEYEQPCRDFFNHDGGLVGLVE